MKPAVVLFFSVFVFMLCVSFYHSTAAEWVLQKNENGIAVYTRMHSGSSFKDVRVVNTVKASLSSIVALLLDTKDYTHWIYGCIESEPLKVISEKELYNYQVTDLPWPMSDRDAISHFLVSQDAATGIVTLTKTGVPDYIPEKESLVRVQHFQSAYRLTPLPGDSVQIELEVSIDPGGSIPAWLVNANLVNAPYKSTEAMVRQLPYYQTAAYSFVREK